MGRSVEQPRSRNHPGRIGEPGRIPERPDLAGGLVARARTPIEVIVGGRIEKKRLHHVHILVVSANLSDWLVTIQNCGGPRQERPGANGWRKAGIPRGSDCSRAMRRMLTRGGGELP